MCYVNRHIAICAVFVVLTLGLVRQPLAAPGDIYLDFMGARVSWADAEYVGHAFLCVVYHLRSGPKEECFGFYPKDNGKAVVGGPGVAANEWGLKQPPRFARVDHTARRKITDDQRRAVMKRIDEFNSKTYQLTSSNCIDLVHDLAGLVGMRRPNRNATQLPSEYVAALKAANPGG